MNRAYEHVLQAMYLHVHHDLRHQAAAGSLFHGATFDRIGMFAGRKQKTGLC